MSNTHDAPPNEAHASSIRPGRSPSRFARLRQTRVASLSPTPTLVAGTAAASARSRSRSTQRGAVFSTDQHGKRKASHSRTRASTSADARTLIDAHEDEGEQRSGKAGQSTSSSSSPPPPPTTTSSSDLEKGKGSPEQGQKGDAAAQPKEPLAVRLLPRPIPHFLGYRRDGKAQTAVLPFLHRIPLALESLVFMFLGSFIGIAIVQLVFARPRHFTSSTDVPPHDWAAPIIVGSFGASSVLLYATPASPLGQPRCFVGGQTLSAVAGVAMTKLIKLAGPYYYDLSSTDTSHSIVWVAGALATGMALVVMTVTGTVHPPGGATAVLCATNMQVERMGWRIIPVVLLSSLLMLTWSLLFMNLGRKRYPESFFAPSPPAVAGGNLSQALIDWMQSKRKAKQQKEKQDKGHSQVSKGARRPASRQSSDKGVWQDQSPWVALRGVNGKSVSPRANGKGLREEADVIHESDEPSRTASTEDDKEHQASRLARDKAGAPIPHENEEEDDVTERAERPSRWANAPARSASSLRGTAP